MPHNKKTGTSSTRGRAPKLSQKELDRRFRKEPSYKVGDIIKGYPDVKYKMLVLDIEDKKTYYQYKLLVLNTGEYTKATAWYLEECLTEYGGGKLPPPIA
jgi:hypothetical protein